MEKKTVLVTGGTGSFGRAFVKILLEKFSPQRVIVFSRDELKQFEMQTESDSQLPTMRFFLGDVRDVDRLEMAFRDVDIVIHAAALKQVPAAEYNPFECIRTNVHGAENVVKASIRAGVKRVIALSTDKAASPINLYGASKLASDKIFTAAHWLVGSKVEPKFSVVRYGNVLGSRGSVVPFFRDQISRGSESLPITDPRMTRFWITLEEGVAFVLSCLPLMQGGEIFVPKIPSMKIVDLARVMAPRMNTHVVGIRPGEKLHESMITSDDARNTYELPDRYVITPEQPQDRAAYHPAERLVREDFSYVSDKNSEWLSDEVLVGLLAGLGISPAA
ncbi:MAG: UDP-N-acetylglucosamine 4,6-dehydratase (inverting) [Alphaproteobacteria bacterium]